MALNTLRKPAMLHTITSRLRYGTFVGLIVCCLPAVSSAATITMFLTDMDVTYLGSANNGNGAIYDAIAQPGADGTFVTANSDELQAASFKLDAAALGTLVDAPANANDNMWGDLRVDGAAAGPGNLSTLLRNAINFNKGADNGTYGFDWFVKSGNTLGNFLRLGLTTVNVTLTDGVNGSGSDFTVSGIATVISQNLPFGLQFAPGQTVQFSYSAPAPGITGVNPVSTTGVLGSGAMTITGIQVPEPATMMLILGAVVGCGALRRRNSAR